MNGKKLFAFVFEHMFITMSGLAALTHSMWSIDVFFAGQETDFSVDAGEAIFRKIIAFFIAAAIDIGQIYTSVEIKRGQRSWQKYGTFAFFALCTYILQFYFMVYHTPHLELSSGIKSDWIPTVKFISDASIWIIPLLLPASTLLYTLSQKADDEGKSEAEEKLEGIERAFAFELQKREEEHMAALEMAKREAAKGITSGLGVPLLGAGNTYRISCPDCGWEKEGYPNTESADNGLRSHRPYCKKTRVNSEVQR